MSKKKIPAEQQYPTIAYKSGGTHDGPNGQKYSYLGCDDEAALRAALDAGYCIALTEACGLATPVLEDEPKDDGAPTRAELEQKAGELGLKFDGRTSDTKLLAEITAAIKAKG